MINPLSIQKNEDNILIVASIIFSSKFKCFKINLTLKSVQSISFLHMNLQSLISIKFSYFNMSLITFTLFFLQMSLLWFRVGFIFFDLSSWSSNFSSTFYGIWVKTWKWVQLLLLMTTTIFFYVYSNSTPLISYFLWEFYFEVKQDL